MSHGLVTSGLGFGGSLITLRATTVEQSLQQLREPRGGLVRRIPNQPLTPPVAAEA